jgi:hypothetical protein
MLFRRDKIKNFPGGWGVWWKWTRRWEKLILLVVFEFCIICLFFSGDDAAYAAAVSHIGSLKSLVINIVLQKS